MTNKVQKIREEVVEIINSINPFIPDEDGKNSNYEAGKLDAATQILQIIDSMQEESVSEKKCLFTKDNYTDEDRIVLCEDCDERCEYSRKEEPVSDTQSPVIFYGLTGSVGSPKEESVSNPIDFKKELYKAFGQVKDFTLGMRIAKWFYDMGKKSREPVSEDLEEAAWLYYDKNRLPIPPEWDLNKEFIGFFKAGAKWQITKLMADATEAVVAIDSGGYPYIDKTIELYDYDKDVPLAKKGDKYKVILIKEE